MTELLETGVAILVTLASAAAGWSVQRVLPDHHRSRDSIDSVRLVITMLVTFAALVLGLLTSNAKSRFDGQADVLSAYAVSLVELDRRLREFGPATLDLSGALGSYVADAIADTWRAERAPAGAHPLTSGRGGMGESPALGARLQGLQARIDALAAADEREQAVRAGLRLQMERVLDLRWRLIGASGSTLPWPLLGMLMLWMVIIFASFGLTSPANPTIYATICLCALLIGSSLFLILDYDSTRAGLIRLSSAPLRNALFHIEQPR